MIKSKLSYSILLIIMMVSACKSKPDSMENKRVPIAEDTFVNMMVDVRIAESIIRKQSSKGVEPQIITKKLYSSLFQKYNTTSSDFEYSVEYYSSDPDRMYEINEKVVEALSLLESEVKAQKHKEKADIKSNKHN